jgi:hypothetical protein
MNKLQLDYLKAKVAYDTAFETEDWELVDQLEDPYLDAEFALADWVFQVAERTGLISKEDLEYIRKNANGEQWDKLIEMGVRLEA